MDSVLKLLGLVYRAKKIVLGEEVLESIKDVKLMLIASDTSDKSVERYLKKCHYYNIEYISKYSSDELSNALGKNNIKLIGIVDEGFKQSLLKKIKEEENG